LQQISFFAKAIAEIFITNSALLKIMLQKRYCVKPAPTLLSVTNVAATKIIRALF
jgi:hypothetical protein